MRDVGDWQSIGREPDRVQARSRLRQAAWALYECARNPFYVLVNIYVFAGYFTTTVIGDAVRGQVVWGYSLSASAACVALLAPLFGAIADAGGRKKPWLASCVAIAVPAAACLWFAQPAQTGNLGWIVLALIVANAGYEVSSVFYNALLPHVADRHRYGSVSGLAYALANLAGVLFFGLYLASADMIDQHFGIDAHVSERLVGPVVAVWWLALSAPLLFFVPDSPAGRAPLGAVVLAGLRSLAKTLSTLRQHPQLFAFLVARMVFNEGFIILMMFTGVFSAGVLGWEARQLSIMGLALSVVAIAGSFVGGYLDDRTGSRATLTLCIVGCAVSNLMLITIHTDSVFFLAVDPIAPGNGIFPRAADRAFFATSAIIAFFVTAGLVSSRAMLAKLAPREMLNEMFGLYALSGTATSFTGPLAIATLTWISGSQRAGLSAGLIFLLGGLLLLRVRKVGVD